MNLLISLGSCFCITRKLSPGLLALWLGSLLLGDLLRDQALLTGAVVLEPREVQFAPSSILIAGWWWDSMTTDLRGIDMLIGFSNMLMIIMVVMMVVVIITVVIILRILCLIIMISCHPAEAHEWPQYPTASNRSPLA